MDSRKDDDKDKPKSAVAVGFACLANLGIACAKFFAAYMSGSSAMLAEGIHSVVDTGNEVFLIIGKRKSKKHADIRHPFGYGREIYFWTLLVGIMIFALGGGFSIFEGVQHLLHPRPIEHVKISYIILLFAAVLESSSLFVGVREYKKSRPIQKIFGGLRGSDDPTIFAVILEDSAAVMGLIFAATGLTLTILSGNPVFDAISSILIGALLMAGAVFLIHEAHELLIGAGVDQSVVDSIRSEFESDPAVTRVKTILSTHLSPREVLLAIDIKARDQGTSRELISKLHELAKKAHEQCSLVKRVYFKIEV